ncbi:hypothetical protein RHSIM_Rhsim03G0158000 [Rhododendron simsii]|uniref:U6 snRNA phosphodiesterase 1 n=1 Tax=Rhododendron simsii TaxID=118357 RepID=A0A834H3K7_RHOSS|nr:hypothetical protein RHSIM_Rhsim03G0158000 [Rhododendron simsii]
MEALRSSYGGDTDSDPLPTSAASSVHQAPNPLPPPPLDLLNPPNSLVRIPPTPKKELTQFLKRVSSLVPGLNAIDVDIPLEVLGGNASSKASVSEEVRYRYLIDFSEWKVFVNDDCTRSFLSVKIEKQIQAVNEVYKLHNLPEFYKIGTIDPRPHISIAWGMGDISDLLKRVVVEALKEFTALRGDARKYIFTCKFSGINRKIGNKAYEICKFQESYIFEGSFHRCR